MDIINEEYRQKSTNMLSINPLCVVIWKVSAREQFESKYKR